MEGLGGGGSKTDLFVPLEAIKCTSWPASRKVVYYVTWEKKVHFRKGRQ